MRSFQMAAPTGELVRIWFPSKEDVGWLIVGSMAPTCFGRLSRVVEVTGRGSTPSGNCYACYRADWSPDGSSTITDSIVADRVQRDCRATAHWKSAELDDIERRALRGEFAFEEVPE